MIRILIVDDHPVVRAGLTSMLRTHADLDVVAAVSDGSQMFASLERVAVDVILLDLRMPGMSGIEVLQRLKEIQSRLRVVVLTSYEGDDYAYEALRAGAGGYLLKACSEEEMIAAIQTVHAGGRYLAHHIAIRLAERMPQAQLCARQSIILGHISRGLTPDQIAHDMGIALPEIWADLSSIIDRLDRSNVESSEDAKERRPTMADIARSAGVSMATVSRVLHNKGLHTEETHRAVMRAVQECDFRMNRTAAALASMRNVSG